MNDIKSGQAALRVVELFAGAGGFRLGLQSVRNDADHACFDVVWSNQFEPGCRKQHAAQVYRARWGDEGFVNRDIDDVLDDGAAMAELAALKPDMLVGGFPCQDYSVATSGQSAGLEGKKGVLWWAIHRLLEAQNKAGRPIQYLLFENVDRLISSPSGCPGRDFAVILSSLQNLGYGVEWRVVNSADYGFPQRRRRVFILGYHRSTVPYQRQREAVQAAQASAWLTSAGTFGKAFPGDPAPGQAVEQFALPADVLLAQDTYRPLKGRSRFQSAGICIDGEVCTVPVRAVPLTDFSRYVGQRAALTLGDVVADTAMVPPSYLIDAASLPRWTVLKGAKRIERVSKTGHAYIFSEGAVAFPEPLDKPSRTIITSEGGTAPSRTKHVVEMQDGRLRRLVPEELEALNGFPRGFTDVPGIPDSRRAFMMGNALVVGIVTHIGKVLNDCRAGAFEKA